MTVPLTVPDEVTVTAPYYLPPKDGARAFKNINDRTDHNYIRDNVQVKVENIRGKEDQYLFHKAGFQFYKRGTNVPMSTFDDKEAVIRDYYPEAAQLYKELTGATRVKIFDHTIRRHRPGDMEESESKRQPVFNVHIDQTQAASRRRVLRHFPEEEANEILKKRFAIVNMWRPINNPAWDTPLGFIDTSTLDEKRDLFPMTLKMPNMTGETWAVKWHEQHKWVYLRGMTSDEVVIFKCYDSDESVCTYNAHSSFVDPTTPEGSPLRESIELRAFLFFD